MSYRGKLWRVQLYTACCSNCGDADTTDGCLDYQSATKTMRALGWRKRKDGWLCPLCAQGHERIMLGI